MKMSFSLSSLQPSSNSLDRQKQTRMPTERLYNSLTKKRKDPKQIQCHRMWTSREDSKDDFWAAIRSNYDYIMDTNLIDSCKETNGELTWDETDVSTQSWSLKEVSCQFSELYSWLRVLQELVYSKEENLLDKSLRAAHMEELRRRAYRRKLFNEQAEKLVSRAPTLKDEVAWRVDHLNAKWELVEQIMAPVGRPVSDEENVSADFEHEVKCLRKWLREMESRLQPLSFQMDWTLTELEEKAMEHMILQRDIEAHGRIVSSVVKLGDRVFKEQQQQEQQRQEQQQEQQLPQALHIAKSLERRWHLLFLRSLEWQCHIETLASRISNKNLGPCRCSSDDSDEEPVTKQPRLSSRRQSRDSSGKESPSHRNVVRANRKERSLRRGERTSRSSRLSDDGGSVSRSTDLSDSDASSENRSIGEGSYFEIPSTVHHQRNIQGLLRDFNESNGIVNSSDELCQLCVMDTGLEETECYERICDNRATRTILESESQAEEADFEEEELASKEERDDMPPTPDTDTVSMTTSSPIDGACDEIDAARNGPQVDNAEQQNGRDLIVANDGIKRSRPPLEEHASLDSSDRKPKNYAVFYVKHPDTDSEGGYCQTNEESPNVMDDSSEEEWTYTSSRGNDCVTSEERKTNVVVRLDFGEMAEVKKTENLRYVPIGRKMLDDGNGGGDDINHGKDKSERATNTVNTTTLPEDSDDEAKNDKSSIQRLIKEVEKLVREERHSSLPRTLPPLILEEKGITNNHRAKCARIKEWLRFNSTRNHDVRSGSQPLDSCDASGEYTTEESDEEKQSMTSEDLQSSIATYRRFEGGLGCVPHSMSQEIFEDADKTPVNDVRPMLDTSTPKVVLRNKQKTNGPRPWSVSCLSQIGNNSVQANDPILQFSISETALHQLITTMPTKSVSLDATGSRKSFDNSTSTLLEGACNDGRVVRNSSLRRKKSRLRKKNLSRKSESSSEGVNANHQSAGSDGSSNHTRSPRKTTTNRTLRTISRDCHGRSTTLVKSGSFSGCTAHQQFSAERTIVSDPTPALTLPCCNLVGSTSDTEGGTRNCAKGCPTCDDNLLDTVLNSKELYGRQFNGDSDVEMNSLGNNSFSEQAWDNYQEKYMSEPYSEAPDVETARLLLDFGDDYRNFLDSQSDCASSMSAVPRSSSPLPRNRMRHEVTDTTEESDSDVEDFRNVTEKSQSNCALAENLFIRSNGALLQDCIDVECACRENPRCLRTLLKSFGGSFRNENNAKQVRGMIEKLGSVPLSVETAQKANALQKELSAMQMELKLAHDSLLSYEIVLKPPHVLDDLINRITAELTAFKERKTALLALNVSSHRLITDLGTSTSLIRTILRDGVADLYRVWDEIFQKGNQQLCALQAVQQFSTRLSELQCDLRRDKDTLAVLDVALQAGVTTEVATTIRRVARLLSEKQDAACQDGTILNDTTSEEVTSGISSITTVNKFGDQSTTNLTQQEGGALSDSGISDSGSEQELSERERRLSALRRLTRSLETQLPPDSAALRDLWKRVEDAETELRNLQKQCGDLIVRTAASIEARTVKRMVDIGQVHHCTDKRKKGTDYYPMMNLAKKTNLAKVAIEVGCIDKRSGITDAGGPEYEPNPSRAWLWRILRFALPFQLALIALFCIAYLLEPQCCEASNTLSLFLTPQLRYVGGPPPI